METRRHVAKKSHEVVPQTKVLRRKLTKKGRLRLESRKAEARAEYFNRYSQMMHPGSDATGAIERFLHAEENLRRLNGYPARTTIHPVVAAQISNLRKMERQEKQRLQYERDRIAAETAKAERTRKRERRAEARAAAEEARRLEEPRKRRRSGQRTSSSERTPARKPRSKQRSRSNGNKRLRNRRSR